MRNVGFRIKLFGTILITLISFIYVFSFFLIPFSDWDTALYPLVGKGIFQYHILPYNYIFEHKPYLVYVFYYIWCEIDIFMNGRFTILSLISIFLISSLISKFFDTRFIHTLFLVFLGGALGNYISGNTEVIQIPIIFLSIIFLAKGVEEKSRKYFIISSIFAVVVININYLSGCILAPLFLYVMLSRSCSTSNSIIILTSGALGIFFIFTPFLISGHGAIIEYFSIQRHFLKNYSASPAERFYTLQTILVKISFIYPALIIWFKNKSFYWENIRGRMLTLWFSFSVIAAIMSGHSYDHYSSLFLIPAMIICAILVKNGKNFQFYAMIPFFLYSMTYMVSFTIQNIHSMRAIERTNPLFVSKIVGNRKVLNIRADHSLYYLANLETFDRFLFTDHIDIFFGKNAEEHYMQDLRQRPDFVLMPFRSCSVFDNASSDSNICKWIKYNYHIVYEAYNHEHPSHITKKYYELYEINK